MNSTLRQDDLEEKYSNLSRLVATLSDKINLKCALLYPSSGTFIYLSDSFIKFIGYERHEVPAKAEELIELLTTNNDDNNLFISLINGTIRQDIPLHDSIPASSMITKLYSSIRNKSGVVINVCFTAISMHSDASGEPEIYLLTLKQSMSLKPSHKMLFYYEGEKKYEYIPQRKKFVLCSGPLLKAMELEILKLASMGYNEQKMAKSMGQNLTYIKYYKKRLFQKLNVSSISEAVYVALKANLL